MGWTVLFKCPPISYFHYLKGKDARSTQPSKFPPGMPLRFWKLAQEPSREIWDLVMDDWHNPQPLQMDILTVSSQNKSKTWFCRTCLAYFQVSSQGQIEFKDMKDLFFEQSREELRVSFIKPRVFSSSSAWVHHCWKGLEQSCLSLI